MRKVEFGIETLDTRYEDSEWMPYSSLYDLYDDALARVQDSIDFWESRGIDYFRIRIFQVTIAVDIVKEIGVK